MLEPQTRNKHQFVTSTKLQCTFNLELNVNDLTSLILEIVTHLF